MSKVVGPTLAIAHVALLPCIAVAPAEPLGVRLASLWYQPLCLRTIPPSMEMVMAEPWLPLVSPPMEMVMDASTIVPQAQRPPMWMSTVLGTMTWRNWQRRRPWLSTARLLMQRTEQQGHQAATVAWRYVIECADEGLDEISSISHAT